MEKALFLIIGFIALAVLIVWIANWFIAFARELKYLNNEICRTEGEELSYWLNRKKRLWLSLLPFFKY